MSGPDDEFEDFLARRRALFGRSADDVLEPPEEVDRLVLRQAREAIETRRPPRAIRGAQWGAPLAVAATLLVALTVVLHGALPRKQPAGEAGVRQVSQQVDYPAATGAPAAAPMSQAADAPSYSPPPPPPPVAGAPPSGPPADSNEVVVSVQPVPAEAGDGTAKAAPAWRRDTQSWLAHIDRLRAQGKSAEADAEMAEYKRQHRAYAVGPGR